MSSNNRDKSADIGKPSLENVNKPLENENILSIKNRKASIENGITSAKNGKKPSDNEITSLENGNILCTEKGNRSSKNVASSSSEESSSSCKETLSSDSEQSSPDSEKSSLGSRDSSLDAGISFSDSKETSQNNIKPSLGSRNPFLGTEISFSDGEKSSPNNIKLSLGNVNSSIGRRNLSLGDVKSTPYCVESSLCNRNSPLGRENSTSDSGLSPSESGFPSAKRTITENGTMGSETKSSYAAEKGTLKYQDLKDKHNLLHAKYEKEKLDRIEADKAFQNLIVLYDDKRTKRTTLDEGKEEVVGKVAEINEQYCVLKQERDEKEKDLTDANYMIGHLKMIIAEEKQKTKKGKSKDLTDAYKVIENLKRTIDKEKQKTNQVKAELNTSREPMDGWYNDISEQKEEELMNKHNGLKQLKDFEMQIKETKKECEELKNKKRLIENKMLDFIKVNDQVIQHSQTCQSQVEAKQEVLETKNMMIEDLMSRDPMDDAIVQNRIKTYETDRNMWQTRAVTLDKEVHSNKITFEKDVRQAEEKRRTEIQDACRIHEILKRDYNDLSEKLNTETLRKDEDILTLIEAAKVLKTDLNELRDKNDQHDRKVTGLKEQVRMKDLEISMLNEVKTRYGEKIQKRQCGKDVFGSILQTLEEELRSEERKVRESETLNSAVQRQLNEDNQTLQHEKQTRLIQEKMLKDNKQKLRRMKSKADSLEHMMRRRR